MGPDKNRFPNFLDLKNAYILSPYSPDSACKSAKGTNVFDIKVLTLSWGVGKFAHPSVFSLKKRKIRRPEACVGFTFYFYLFYAICENFSSIRLVVRKLGGCSK